MNEVELRRAFTATEALLNRIYKRLKKFPKSETHALSKFIKKCFFESAMFIAQAIKVKSKRKTYLQEAEGILIVLKMSIRLARNERYIGKKFFTSIDLELGRISNAITESFKMSTRQ